MPSFVGTMEKECRMGLKTDFSKSLILGGFLILNSSLLTSCSSSSINKFAAKSSANLLYEVGKDLESEQDFDFFKDAVPANLKVVEGMLSLDPNNSTLLATLTKGYTAYAFAIRETQYQEFLYSNAKEEVLESLKEQTLISYSKAHQFGQRYFASKGLSFDKVIELQNDPELLKKKLDENLGSSIEAIESVMFTAQSLGTIINLRKDEMGLIARLPIVKTLFDWSCQKKPDLAFGACDIFYGTYELSRPKMLGGNPELGKKIFQDAIKKYPENWLIAVSYLQFGAIPLSEKEIFDDLKPALDESENSWKKSMQYSIDENPINLGDKKLRVYQMIAMKRWALIKKYQKNIF